ETVADGLTGVLYGEPGPEGLAAAVERLRTLGLDAGDAVRSASRFSRVRFREGFASALDAALRGAGRPDLAEAAAPRIRA
ncbi:MAG TPA: glycosyltransferase family 4 protein, partial [Thermoanaerobaculia bacterium]|nr:glycosyltransferase family 4 protein [Thermoanaerobaculia bacterium]